MRMREYFVALGKDWVSLMSGIASLILAFWAAYFPLNNIYAGRTLLWIAAVACFVVTSYRLWAKERNTSLAKQAEHERIMIEKERQLKELTEKMTRPVVGSIGPGWEPFIEVFSEEIIFNLKSKDKHQIRWVRCMVEDPEGVVTVAVTQTAIDILENGEVYFVYPRNFDGASPCQDGTYKVRWEVRRNAFSSNYETIARANYQVYMKRKEQ